MNVKEVAATLRRTAVIKWIVGILSVIVLTITYWMNCIDHYNSFFGQLSTNSEALVMGTVYQKYRGGNTFAGNYGLGWSVPVNVSWTESGETYYLTDDERNFKNGYWLNGCKIAVANNSTDKIIYEIGNTIEFATGIQCAIVNVAEDEDYLYVEYDYTEALDENTGGTLALARVFSNTGQLYMNSNRGGYESQYGLQGKVFAKLATFFPIMKAEHILKLLCSFAMAMVVVLICCLLIRKYNYGIAIVFGLTCWLSPWVVGFASNMYWLEALLFLPMLIGLLCSIEIEKRWIRMLCYICIFGAILVKSLCGYEYITVVMLTSIAFLLSDTVRSFVQKSDKKAKILLFRTIFIFGVCALLGFIAALCVHAKLRGSGDIWAGLVSIYEKDVLRRTLGGNADAFDQGLAASLNASIGSVVATYFDFSNSPYKMQLVLGISGKAFPVLLAGSAISVIVFLVKSKGSDATSILYVIMFLCCISWFVFGKAHSYIHTHLNYLMWYLGFVQLMMYHVCRGIVALGKFTKKGIQSMAGASASKER